ncbi:MAG TPA: Cof-type HAD-IIB family hydrolase [Terriglobales bacterium]|nr:Cof-type HAD-IIB family hydrolase [Terriglobales bacterium]
MSQSHQIPDLQPEVRLVVSDVDGTLLDEQKQLSPRSVEAVFKVRQAGIRFTLVSARPPVAAKPLIDQLAIIEPVACFNGGLIVSPRLEAIRRRPLNPDDARLVSAVILEHSLGLWAYTERDWYVADLNGAHVASHRLHAGLTPLPFTEAILHSVDKLVGVSDDFNLVSQCERDLRTRSNTHISATRSADFYLDVTHYDANKGNAILSLAKLLGVDAANIATIGDMPTDVLMFRRSGLSIAMGNASREVKSAAQFVTSSNQEDGFSLAMERFILPSAPRGAEETAPWIVPSGS